MRDAHSVYLEALAETGLPGALLVVVAFGALLVGGAHRTLPAVVAAAAGAAAGCAGAFVVFVIAAGVDWMWESTAVTLLALACGMLGAASQSRDVEKPRPRTRIGITVLAAGRPGAARSGAGRLPAARGERGSCAGAAAAEAAATATTAINLQPWSALAYRQRALVLEKSGLLAAAAKDARKAVELESENYENWLILGRIEVERARPNAGLRAARRAQALHPRGTEFSRNRRR